MLKNRKLGKAALKADLEALGIRHFDQDVRTMSRAELAKNFGAKSSGRIPLAHLIKNIIWQAYEKIRDGGEPPIAGNIRTFWYLWVKPALSRARLSRKPKTDPYETMLFIFTQLVLDRRLFRYSDFDFTDERWENRRIGTTRPEVLVFAEKTGAIRFLRELHEELGVSILALGGQPGALSSEYTARDISAALTEKTKIRLIGIVDYDPSGDIIAQSFKSHLAAVGLTNIRMTADLIHPKNYSEEEIEMFRFPIPKGKGESAKLAKWLEKTGGIDGEAYGLETESMPRERLRALITKLVIGDADQLKMQPTKKLKAKPAEKRKTKMG
jgi:hypothetical protein